MKYFALVLALVFCSVPLCAQDQPNELAAAGMAWNEAASPQLNGWATYARLIGKGVYSLSTYDISPVKIEGSTIPSLQAQLRTGIAIYMRQFGRLSIYGLGDAGIATTGDTTGGSFGGGGLGIVTLGKGWCVFVPIRLMRNNVTGTQVVYELGVGWGK